MKITPLNALTDNYIWLIESSGETICIDPGEAAPVLRALADKNKTLSTICLTHRHADHIGGINELTTQFPQCRIYGSAHIGGVDNPVKEGDVINYSEGKIEVWATPGHTQEHMSFLLREKTGQLHVFCGDTLFSGGCGRVFDGTMLQLQNSLARFETLPESTLFYPAHEYTAKNLDFAAQIEADNPDILHALKAAMKQAPTLPVTLAHEKAINPFLRFRQPSLRQQIASKLGIPDGNDTAIFSTLRLWKDKW